MIGATRMILELTQRFGDRHLLAAAAEAAATTAAFGSQAASKWPRKLLNEKSCMFSSNHLASFGDGDSRKMPIGLIGGWLLTLSSLKSANESEHMHCRIGVRGNVFEALNITNVHSSFDDTMGIGDGSEISIRLWMPGSSSSLLLWSHLVLSIESVSSGPSSHSDSISSNCGISTAVACTSLLIAVAARLVDGLQSYRLFCLALSIGCVDSDASVDAAMNLFTISRPLYLTSVPVEALKTP